MQWAESRSKVLALGPGLLPIAGIAVVAFVVGRFVPILGAPVIGIMLGLSVRQVMGERASWQPGVTFASKKILQTSIVILGFTMSLREVVVIGGKGLPVMIGTLAAALIVGVLVGRALGIETQTRKLVTYGTAICGASAIATMAAVISASSTAVAFSMTVIVVYNVLGAVLFPPIGHLMGLSQESFGLWAGTAINDTSSVVAAATVYGAAAASYAVVVKLTRTLAIIPMAVFESARVQSARAEAVSAESVSAESASQHPTKPHADSGMRRWYRLVPPFLVLFVLATAIRSTGMIPDEWGPTLKMVALLGTTLAMAGVGLGSSFSELRAAGWRPVALGGILWLTVVLSSLGLQALIGQL